MPLSYRLHQQLAAEHGGAEKWGYRRVGCGSIGAIVKDADIQTRKAAKEEAHARAQIPAPVPTPLVDENGTTAPPTSAVAAPGQNGEAGETDGGKDEAGDKDKEWEKLPKQDTAAASLLTDSALPSDLDWIDASLVQHYEDMGKPGFTETAQVHPFHFTTSIAELAKSGGVDIRLGAKVTKINQGKAAVESIEYEDRQSGETRTLENVTDVVVTAGPWTGKLLPRSKVEGLRAHSVVYEAEVSPYAVFTDVQLPSDYIPEHRAQMGQKRKHRGNVDPEIYARPFGEVYACGKFSTTRLDTPKT